jgi:hypothetical protein
LVLGPADEVSGVAAVGGLFAGDPGVEVSLPGGGQREVVGGEPVEQREGALDVLFDDDGLTVGGGLIGQPVTEPPQQMPDGVAVQQLLLIGIGPVVDGAGDPVFQSGDVLVSRRQCSDGDQDTTQVFDGFAGRPDPRTPFPVLW